MRISDWSSDVCSSDLMRQGVLEVRPEAVILPDKAGRFGPDAGGPGGAVEAHHIEHRGAGGGIESLHPRIDVLDQLRIVRMAQPGPHVAVLGQGGRRGGKGCDGTSRYRGSPEQ